MGRFRHLVFLLVNMANEGRKYREDERWEADVVRQPTRPQQQQRLERP